MSVSIWSAPNVSHVASPDATAREFVISSGERFYERDIAIERPTADTPVSHVVAGYANYGMALEVLGDLAHRAICADDVVLPISPFKSCDYEISDGNQDDPSFAYCGYSPAHCGPHGDWVF